MKRFKIRVSHLVAGALLALAVPAWAYQAERAVVSPFADKGDGGATSGGQEGSGAVCASYFVEAGEALRQCDLLLSPELRQCLEKLEERALSESCLQRNR